jgi:hypothetical protein
VIVAMVVLGRSIQEEAAEAAVATSAAGRNTCPPRR